MQNSFVNFVFPKNIIGTRTKIAFGCAFLEIVIAVLSSIFKFGIIGAIIFAILALVSNCFARII